MKNQLLEAWAILTSDRKKASVLGSLVLVAGGLWLRAAITSGPKSANASSKTRMTESGKKRAEKSAKAEKDAPRLTRTRVVEMAPPPELQRDLFMLSDALLASSPQTEPNDMGTPKSAGGKVDKSLRPAVIAAQTIEERVASEAARLQLRSTMIGANPTAVIESDDTSRSGATVVRVGNTVAGFTVIAIRAREVELEKEHVRVTIARSN